MRNVRKVTASLRICKSCSTWIRRSTAGQLRIRNNTRGFTAIMQTLKTSCSCSVVVRPPRSSRRLAAVAPGPLPRTTACPAVRRQRVVVYSGNDAASQVADASGGQAGQISSAVINSMKQKIGEALETDKVSITDVYGDGRHVCIDVVSPLFAGQSSMQRQRMVYKAIWLELQEAVHAVDAMVTKTPEEAGAS